MRVKIVFPEGSPISLRQIPVRIGDINYGGHLGNDALLSIIHESRMQWLAEWGMTELVTGDHGLIMADVMIAYRGEAFYGDILSVALFATEITSKSFDLLYRLETQRDEKNILIAEAKTGMLCFDYEQRKITAMGEKLASALKNLG
jgi:acyl-CoA thioester hydrolase